MQILICVLAAKKKLHKKYYSYGKLLNENNFAVLIILISRWQFMSSRCQIRGGYVTAKRKTHAKLSTCEIYEGFWKRKNRRLCPFSFAKAKAKEKKKAFSRESAADLGLGSISAALSCHSSRSSGEERGLLSRTPAGNRANSRPRFERRQGFF